MTYLKSRKLTSILRRLDPNKSYPESSKPKPKPKIPDVVHSPLSVPKINQEPTSDPRLPPELLIKIFKELSLSLHHVYDSCAHDRDGINTPDVLPKSKLLTIRHAQLPLYNVTLVCRAWLPTATEVLYESIVVVGAPNIHFFQATLKSQPSLAKMVKRLSIHDNLTDIDQPGLFDRTPKLSQQVRKDFISIVDMCSSLTDLSVDLLPVRKAPEPTIADFAAGPKAFSRLKSLTVSGLYLTHLLPHLSLPHLQTLHLKHGMLQNPNGLPPLPSLTSLELKYQFYAHPSVLFDKQRFPNLRTFHAINCAFTMHQPQDPSPELSPLRTVISISSDPLYRVYFKSLSESGILGGIEHLSFGVLFPGERGLGGDGGSGGSLGGWRFPRGLRSLYFAVSLREQGGMMGHSHHHHHPAREEEDRDRNAGQGLEVILKCLKKNFGVEVDEGEGGGRDAGADEDGDGEGEEGRKDGELKGSSDKLGGYCLERLHIGIARAPPQKVARVEPILKDIRDLCEGQGVVFKVDRGHAR